jgi:hypothetical protein
MNSKCTNSVKVYKNDLLKYYRRVHEIKYGNTEVRQEQRVCGSTRHFDFSNNGCGIPKLSTTKKE